MLHHTESLPAAAGPSGSMPREPVVLLHAFPMDSLLWAPQRLALADAGYRVITPDLPGFGGSGVSAEHPSMEVMADEVVALMDDLGIPRARVGGLSMGGYVAMALLRRHPERISGLILADTKATADPPEAAANRLVVAESVLAAGTAAGLAEVMVANLVGATTRASRPQVVDTVTRWIAAQPAAGVAWAQRAMAARPDSHPDLAAFTGPVLIVYGAQDTISPAADAVSMAEAARRGGGAVEVVEVPAVGHLSAVEDPDAVTAVLKRWLASLDPAR